MPDEKNEGSGFKVVDRRIFSPDGTRRESVRQEENPPSSPATSTRPPAPQEEREPEPSLEEGGDSGFETLVSYLSTTAMFQMGLLAGPGGERIPADMVNARRTIDLLEVLQQKTRGNLTQGESRMLDDVLCDLRMSCVEIEKQPVKKRK